MKKSFFAQVVSGLLLAVAVFALAGCGDIIYHEPEFQYAGRTVPPSGLLQRVLATYTTNGSSGGAEILDGLRDTRSNVQDTIPAYFIKGYSAADPVTIINFPEQQRGYILSQTDGVLGNIDYATEASTGTAASFGSYSTSVAASPDGSRFAGVNLANGVIVVSDANGTFSLNLPNAYKIVINPGNSIVLAMVRNSNTLYRVIKLPVVTSNAPIYPANYVDCEPLQTPRYCVVPVGTTAEQSAHLDHPYDAYFSLDGTKVFVLNCGPECGGTQSSLAVLNPGPLQVDNLCISGLTNSVAQPLCTTYTTSTAIPTPYATLSVANPIPVPGGVTVALSDGVSLYMAGQNLQTSSRFSGKLLGGNLTVMPLNTLVPGAPISISDGTHTKLLFGDDGTLWIGSQQCANGVRNATAIYELANGGTTDQAGNYNCLTTVTLGGASLSPIIVPSVVQSATAPVTVPFPNTNLDEYYYDNLTGLCMVQGWHKVFTAYGGQIHAFYTGGTITDTDDPGYGTTHKLGDEIDNRYLTVQGTVLDVAYMDAITNNAN